MNGSNDKVIYCRHKLSDLAQVLDSHNTRILTSIVLMEKLVSHSARADARQYRYRQSVKHSFHFYTHIYKNN